MGMIGNFYLVDDELIRSLLADPSAVHAVVEAAEEGDEDDRFEDIGKSWHCLHYLLTGTVGGGDPPLDFIVSGGVEVGDEDVGYGRARAFSSSNVAAIAEALRPIGHAELVRRFDARRMDELEIYPHAGRWSEVVPTSEEFGYYLDGFDALERLVERGHSEGLGLLAWLG